MTNKTDELRQALSAHMKTPIKTGADSSYATGYWPSGIMPLDAVLGGGWMKGRFALITGESQTLKSFAGVKTIALAQQSDATVALIDTEHAYDPGRGAALGINNESMILIQPETGEEAVDQMEFLIRNDIDLIVFDSIAAMLPESDRKIQLSGKDSPQPARIAALMSIALRKLNTANTKSAVLWITQKRANIGAMAFAPRTNNTGGKAIEFYVSQSVEFRRTNKLWLSQTYWNGEKEETDKQLIGQGFRVELTKARNKQPFDVSHFVYDYEVGDIDMANYLIGEGLATGIINRPNKTTWIASEINSDGEVLNEYKASGKDNFHELVASNPAVYNLLLRRVADSYGLEANNYGLLPIAEPEGVHAILNGSL